jgi:hypothetical protein
MDRFASAQVTINKPQETVECTGWHAVCAMATGCKVVDQNTADCACWKVNERHVVFTIGIKDATFGGDPIMKETRETCTTVHPCGLDEAPVCQEIKNLLPGKWVSTFSYRGWCKNWKALACEDKNEGLWADCMTSSCSESQDPQDRHRPLNCQCTVHKGAFVGTNGTCNSPAGTVMSTIDISFWDFDNGMFSSFAEMPANEYVNKEACGRLSSDTQE